MDYSDVNEKEKICAYKNIRHAAECIVFLLLLGFVFTRLTYIVRMSGATYDRLHTVGLRQENVDMIYIGGSAAFVYWQPLKAWHDNGLTSYLYAHNSISAETIRYYIQEAQKIQDAKLYVIDVRCFQYWAEKGQQDIRNALTGLDVFSINRWRLIDKYFYTRDTSGLSEDRVTFYWDIIKFHTLTANLASPDAWKLINNSAKHSNKGFEWIFAYNFLNHPVNYATDDRAELHPTCQSILVDLLEYCRREDLNVLFVVCPYVINEEHQKIYNTLGDIVESYGFDFLNTNCDSYYDEMGIDFSSDFYHTDHVNPLGANKYTAFLEKYITDHYDLPNHSEDPAYSSWDEDYQRFAAEFIKSGVVTDLISRAKDGMNIAEHMASADNIFEWNTLAMEDDRFTILFAQNGEINTPEIAEQRAFERWGLSLESVGDIRVISNKSIIFTNADSRETSYSGFIDKNSGQGITYTISNENGKISIVVDGTEYAPDWEGIYIVVINNDYRRVVDVLTATCEDGHFVFRR